MNRYNVELAADDEVSLNSIHLGLNKSEEDQIEPNSSNDSEKDITESELKPKSEEIQQDSFDEAQKVLENVMEDIDFDTLVSTQISEILNVIRRN